MKKESSKVSEGQSAFYLCIMLILITLTVFNISFYLFSKPKTFYVTKNDTVSKETFWRTFLESHPSYNEGWIQLAKLDIQNGDKSGAEIAIQNAWKINPNSLETQNLKIKIQN